MRLPMISARKLIQALQRAGFVEDGQKGSHYYMWHPIKKLTTCVPIHGGDLKRGLVRKILEQADLTDEEFLKLI